MEKNNGIWVGEKDLSKDPGFIEISEQEFASLPEKENFSEAVSKVSGNRRDFLKMLGFGLGAATIAAGCDTPIKKAIPYVIKPDSIVPGVATYYASTFVNGTDMEPVLVKTREGRPIKIEGNDLSSMNNGGTGSRAQASVLSLYDESRFQAPQMLEDDSFTKLSWSELDSKVKMALGSSSSIKIVSNTLASPTDLKAIEAFKAKYPNAEHVQYDSVSYAALLDANEECFGERVLPEYHFDKAEVIVSFDADFLGSWISPTEYSVDFVKNRKLDRIAGAKMSRLIQVEAGMSLTGSNADNRVLVKPSEQGAAIVTLYNYVTGGNLLSPNLNAKAKSALKKVAEELKNNKGKSLIVSGSNNKAEQAIVNALNNALGNVGNTLTFAHASLQAKGDDRAMADLIASCKSGAVDAVVLWNCDPVYDFAGATNVAEAISKVKHRIALAYANNDSVNLCTYIAPTHHTLESWGDVEIKKGQYSLIQPTISPLFSTRQPGHSILVWADAAEADADPMSFVQDYWKENVFGTQSAFSNFNTFWQSCLHNGVFEGGQAGSELTFSGSPSSYAASVTKPSGADVVEISFYETSNMGNGAYQNNPWLMELPDPVMRTVWGNHLAIPVKFDGFRKILGLNNLNDGDLVDVTIGGETITVPVVKQFGQMPGTVSLALGYGRSVVGKCGQNIGVNVNPFVKLVDGYRTYSQSNIEVSNKKGEDKLFASVQYHHSYGLKDTDSKTGKEINADEAALVSFDYGMGIQGYQGALTDRSVMFYSSLDELEKEHKGMMKRRHHYQHLNEQQIYKGHDAEYERGHHWGMHIDLNSCTGCGACAVSCMAENNVPVVGKKEVNRHHEMTWLRIDRYFFGDLESPNAVYQPMMCQHCDNAPCENVCPVNATNHSSEGLNQMTYNRCVGTRYCANNCPYKVRRFNWLDYTTADLFPGNQPALNGEETAYGTSDLFRMVLNPDVTVRVRGVIEKCSFCIQRIQEGKLTAKKEGRALRDSDVKTACQTACATEAITFGDMNNSSGNLAKKMENPLNFIALEEVNVRSSVQYTMKVVNKKELDA